MKTWQWAGQGGWGQMGTVSHVAICPERGSVLVTGWGLPGAAPLASVSSRCSGSRDLLPFRLSNALVSPLGEPSFPQRTDSW